MSERFLSIRTKERHVRHRLPALGSIMLAGGDLAHPDGDGPQLEVVVADTVSVRGLADGSPILGPAGAPVPAGELVELPEGVWARLGEAEVAWTQASGGGPAGRIYGAGWLDPGRDAHPLPVGPDSTRCRLELTTDDGTALAQRLASVGVWLAWADERHVVAAVASAEPLAQLSARLKPLLGGDARWLGDDESEEEGPGSVEVEEDTSPGQDPPVLSLREELESLERRRIGDALESHRTQTEAAKALGIPLRTFLNRMDALGIPRARKSKRKE